ncbi:bifunctional riboflavin kinase/FAD synthetase [Cyclobacterium amurskyense]|uniref:Riboflavin biosynthesis protein n=1 Tax=Cyclobacterium amurskyense TaxID=320787 RepID=A0A0H4PLW3_9BACT|nr:bifunctional riboflavin kinase/FAD synthetase [Cyclobacterium amurskyense]AKP54015.1 Riboflavin biosynthesis protein RibF [Cyclobacterium amurskyense]|tara:strand:+ start:36076 stop:37026 length:951 start_codon:yes stop_codon:yes gene_type:complete
MKIYKSLDDFPDIQKPVVTIGSFDGVHLGHQKILKRLKNIAKSINGETVLVSFWPHPRMVLFPESHGIKLLYSFNEKVALLESFGIDHLLSIPFTMEFSKMESKDFIEKILVEKIKTKKLVIGYDHRFGRGREGSFAHLHAEQGRYNFELEEIPRKDIDNIGISSTKIRKALETGNIVLANEFLGRPYNLQGEVIEGDKIGRTIGFPTANIKLEEKNKLVPMDGAYIVRVLIEDKAYEGMLNIGIRPTISGERRNIEVNILDFDQDIYGKIINMELLAFLRSEKKFENLNALKKQLNIDQEQVVDFFSATNKKSND